MPGMTSFDPDTDFAHEGDAQFEERLNGADLYFEVTGSPGSSDPALVFLHGGPGYNSYSFRSLFGDRLAETLPQRRVMYLDQRGAGRSGPLEDTDQGGDTLDLDTLVGDLEAVREFPDAEPFVDSGSQLFLVKQGLAVVGRQDISALRMS